MPPRGRGMVGVLRSRPSPLATAPSLEVEKETISSSKADPHSSMEKHTPSPQPVEEALPGGGVTTTPGAAGEETTTSEVPESVHVVVAPSSSSSQWGSTTEGSQRSLSATVPLQAQALRTKLTANIEFDLEGDSSQQGSSTTSHVSAKLSSESTIRDASPGSVDRLSPTRDPISALVLVRSISDGGVVAPGTAYSDVAGSGIRSDRSGLDELSHTMPLPADGEAAAPAPPQPSGNSAAAESPPSCGSSEAVVHITNIVTSSPPRVEIPLWLSPMEDRVSPLSIGSPSTAGKSDGGASPRPTASLADVDREIALQIYSFEGSIRTDNLLSVLEHYYGVTEASLRCVSAMLRCEGIPGYFMPTSMSDGADSPTALVGSPLNLTPSGACGRPPRPETPLAAAWSLQEPPVTMPLACWMELLSDLGGIVDWRLARDLAAAHAKSSELRGGSTESTWTELENAEKKRTEEAAEEAVTGVAPKAAVPPVTASEEVVGKEMPSGEKPSPSALGAPPTSDRSPSALSERSTSTPSHNYYEVMNSTEPPSPPIKKESVRPTCERHVIKYSLSSEEWEELDSNEGLPQSLPRHPTDSALRTERPSLDEVLRDMVHPSALSQSPPAQKAAAAASEVDALGALVNALFTRLGAAAHELSREQKGAADASESIGLYPGGRIYGLTCSGFQEVMGQYKEADSQREIPMPIIDGVQHVMYRLHRACEEDREGHPRLAASMAVSEPYIDGFQFRTLLMEEVEAVRTCFDEMRAVQAYHPSRGSFEPAIGGGGAFLPRIPQKRLPLFLMILAALCRSEAVEFCGEEMVQYLRCTPVVRGVVRCLVKERYTNRRHSIAAATGMEADDRKGKPASRDGQTEDGITYFREGQRRRSPRRYPGNYPKVQARYLEPPVWNAAKRSTIARAKARREFEAEKHRSAPIRRTAYYMRAALQVKPISESALRDAYRHLVENLATSSDSDPLLLSSHGDAVANLAGSVAGSVSTKRDGSFSSSRVSPRPRPQGASSTSSSSSDLPSMPVLRADRHAPYEPSWWTEMKGQLDLQYKRAGGSPQDGGRSSMVSSRRTTATSQKAHSPKRPSSANDAAVHSRGLPPRPMPVRFAMEGSGSPMASPKSPSRRVVPRATQSAPVIEVSPTAVPAAAAAGDLEREGVSWSSGVGGEARRPIPITAAAPEQSNADGTAVPAKTSGKRGRGRAQEPCGPRPGGIIEGIITSAAAVRQGGVEEAGAMNGTTTGVLPPKAPSSPTAQRRAKVPPRKNSPSYVKLYTSPVAGGSGQHRRGGRSPHRPHPPLSRVDAAGPRRSPSPSVRRTSSRLSAPQKWLASNERALEEEDVVLAQSGGAGKSFPFHVFATVDREAAGIRRRVERTESCTAAMADKEVTKFPKEQSGRGSPPSSRSRVEANGKQVTPLSTARGHELLLRHHIMKSEKSLDAVSIHAHRQGRAALPAAHTSLPRAANRPTSQRKKAKQDSPSTEKHRTPQRKRTPVSSRASAPKRETRGPARPITQPGAVVRQEDQRVGSAKREPAKPTRPATAPQKSVTARKPADDEKEKEPLVRERSSLEISVSSTASSTSPLQSFMQEKEHTASESDDSRKKSKILSDKTKASSSSSSNHRGGDAASAADSRSSSKSSVSKPEAPSAQVVREQKLEGESSKASLPSAGLMNELEEPSEGEKSGEQAEGPPNLSKSGEDTASRNTHSPTSSSTPLPPSSHSTDPSSSKLSPRVPLRRVEMSATEVSLPMYSSRSRSTTPVESSSGVRRSASSPQATLFESRGNSASSTMPSHTAAMLSEVDSEGVKEVSRPISTSSLGKQIPKPRGGRSPLLMRPQSMMGARGGRSAPVHVRGNKSNTPLQVTRQN